MKPDQLLRAILPEVLIDNFDIDRFEKSDTRLDIWLDEKKEQLRKDRYNKNIISNGFGDYRTIQDYPKRGRSTCLHVRKRKWLSYMLNFLPSLLFSHYSRCKTVPSGSGPGEHIYVYIVVHTVYSSVMCSLP